MGDKVSLRDYVDTRFGAMDLAVAEVKSTTNERFRGVNEFRGALTDQAKSFITRAEFVALETRFQALDIRVTRSEGRTTGLGAGWGYLIGAVGAMAGVVSVIVMVVTLWPKA